jgi:hypothetical protein
MKHKNHRPKCFISLLSIGIILGIITCSTEHSTPFTLPKPTGPYAIGIKNLFLVDENRPETFTPDPDDHREISAVIWYPAEKPEKGKPVSFMEHYQEKAKVFKHFAPLPDSIFKLISLVMTHSYRDTPFTKGKKSFPLLVFSHAYWAGKSTGSGYEILFSGGHRQTMCIGVICYERSTEGRGAPNSKEILMLVIPVYLASPIMIPLI